MIYSDIGKTGAHTVDDGFILADFQDSFEVLWAEVRDTDR